MTQKKIKNMKKLLQGKTSTRQICSERTDLSSKFSERKGIGDSLFLFALDIKIC
jgi:hypothetical protein